MNGLPPQTIDELLESWTLAGHRPLAPATNETFKSLFERLEFLERRFYSGFIPALFPPHAPNYLERLRLWLTNTGVTETDQRILFQLAGHISYFSFEDFLQLYRSAFLGPVARWIIDELKLTLNDPAFAQSLLREQLRHTWYCPVTDSMVISEFYHANRITGIDQRPGFRSMKAFGDERVLRTYMNPPDKARHLKRLVLLEDFVGSGCQSASVVEWAVSVVQCPVLFVPLIVCPDGIDKLNALVARVGADKLRVEPILLVDGAAFVHEDGRTNDAFFQALEALAQAKHPLIVDNPDTTYGPLGFCAPTDACKGAAVVLFSNTPDNSLPLIHHHLRHPSQWNALFPRVSRECT